MSVCSESITFWLIGFVWVAFIYLRSLLPASLFAGCVWAKCFGLFRSSTEWWNICSVKIFCFYFLCTRAPGDDVNLYRARYLAGFCVNQHLWVNITNTPSSSELNWTLFHDNLGIGLCSSLQTAGKCTLLPDCKMYYCNRSGSASAFQFGFGWIAVWLVALAPQTRRLLRVELLANWWKQSSFATMDGRCDAIHVAEHTIYAARWK